MKALDLFCGAGGASMGLRQAGYEVTGVDIAPQKHYPFRFVQADALTFPLEGYDLVWASPPCQFGSVCTPTAYKAKHPNLIPATRERLRSQSAPYIIENVAGSRAHLINPVMLCGTMFGLNLWRHRYFELGNTDCWFLTPPCRHTSNPILLSGHSSQRIDGKRVKGCVIEDMKAASGIDWMLADSITLAIPPVYAQFLVQQIQHYEYVPTQEGHIP